MIKTKNGRIPKIRENRYGISAVNTRRAWLAEETGTEFEHISTIEPEYCYQANGNIENLIGHVTLPLGIAGPLRVKGEYADDTFYIPFATTEATLVESISVTMEAISVSGGIKTVINNDEIHITPVFMTAGIEEARNLIQWIEYHCEAIKEEAESTTRYGKVKGIETFMLGRRVLVKMYFTTKDAMGANIITMAAEKACRFIKRHRKVDYFLRSNFSSEKKVSALNFSSTYGKNVSVETVLTREVLKKYLRTTPEDVYEFWVSNVLGAMYTGSTGMNGHFANTLAAVYIACGQDVASITNSSVGIAMAEITSSGDLYVSLKIPNLVVSTLGGGCSLNTQRECLELLGCYGPGKVKKFTEIVAASLLAGEVAIGAALAGGYFALGHLKARKVRQQITEELARGGTDERD